MTTPGNSDPGLRSLIEQVTFPPASSQGTVLAARDGGGFTYGTASFAGSMGGQHLNAPIVGVATTPDGLGYWLVGSDGGVFAFGDASFDGSMGDQRLNAPIAGMAPTREGGRRDFARGGCSARGVLGRRHDGKHESNQDAHGGGGAEPAPGTR